MRQADLPLLGMALLRAVKVGHPKRRPVPVQHLGHHAGAAAAADDMDHHLAVLEHPVPAGAAINAHAGLVRAHHPGAAQPGKNGGDIGINVHLATAECSVERTLAAGCESIQRDGQAEQLAQQPAQPLVTDRVNEAQIRRTSGSPDIAKATMPTLNGVPDSSLSGTGASVVPPQHRQWPA